MDEVDFTGGGNLQHRLGSVRDPVGWIFCRSVSETGVHKLDPHSCVVVARLDCDGHHISQSRRIVEAALMDNMRRCDLSNLESACVGRNQIEPQRCVT